MAKKNNYFYFYAFYKYMLVYRVFKSFFKNNSKKFFFKIIQIFKNFSNYKKYFFQVHIFVILLKKNLDFENFNSIFLFLKPVINSLTF